MARSTFKSEKLTTPVFRISYPHLFEAQKIADDPNSKPKFSCQAIFDPKKFSDSDKVAWKKMLNELNRASSHEFSKKFFVVENGKIAIKAPANVKTGLRDGEEREGTEGYGAGVFFASLSSKMRPGVVDKSKSTISEAEGNADEIYPGCYCRATVLIYPFKNKGKGVAFLLANVQKIKDGPRLDNRTNAEDDFDEEVDAAWMDEESGDADNAGDDFD